MIHRKMLVATAKTFHLLKSMRSNSLVWFLLLLFPPNLNKGFLLVESKLRTHYQVSGEMELPDSRPLWWEQSAKGRRMLGSSARWGKIRICWRCWWAIQNWRPSVRMLRVTLAERWGRAFWGIEWRERTHKSNGYRELTAIPGTFAMKKDREMGHHQILDYLQEETEFQRVSMIWPKSHTDEWYLNLDLWHWLSLNPMLSSLAQTDPPVSQVFYSGFVFP